jgi:hypothetical protein
MTVPANLNRVDYTGTGSAGPFTVPFPFYDASHLTVLQTDALFNQTTLTGWTATGAGGPSGAVTLAAACPVGSTLTIMRLVPLTQITSIKNQEAFYPEVHEQEMDLLAMADQQLDEAMDRTLRLPAGLSGVDMTLPKPDPGHALVWNAAGDGLENAGSASATLQQDLADSADVAKGDAMIAVKQPFAGAVARTQHDKNAEWVSVKDFGAVGDGVVDDADAINLALSSGAKKIHAPYGIYKILKTIAIPKGVSLIGDGISATIFDASSAVYADLTNGVHINSTQGTLDAISDISADITKGDLSIVFADANHGLTANDVFVIYNPTDYSWSAWRNYYRAGEFCKVASVSGATVTLQNAIVDSYVASAVDVYKLNGGSSKLSDFTLIGLNSTTNQIKGIDVNNGIDCIVENVKVSNCSYIQIQVKRCFNVSLNDVVCNEDFINSFGGDYGLVIANSQFAAISGGYFAAARHGITTGGAAEIGDVTVRFLKISEAHISTTGNVSALDFHGNTEYAQVSNCSVNGALVYAGNHLLFDNVLVLNEIGHSAIALYGAELNGLDVVFNNCYVKTNTYSTSGFGCFIDMGTPGGSFGPNVKYGGNFIVQNCVFETYSTDSGGAGNTRHGIYIYNSGYAGSEPINITIKNNKILSHNIVKGNGINVRGVYSTGSTIESVEISGNQFKNFGYNISHSTAAKTIARNVVFSNNILNGGNSTCFIEDVSNSVIFKNNFIEEMYGCPSVYGTGGGILTDLVHASENTIKNCGKTVNTSSSSRAALVYANVNRLISHGNVTGTNNRYLQVASNAGFVVGETVTGGTSGATAVIYSLSSTMYISIAISRTGTFTPGETITGGTSLASTTLTDIFSTDLYSESYITITKLWSGRNVDLDGLAPYKTGIGTDTAI